LLHDNNPCGNIRKRRFRWKDKATLFCIVQVIFIIVTIAYLTTLWHGNDSIKIVRKITFSEHNSVFCSTREIPQIPQIPDKQQKYFIAINLHDNQEVMPDMMQQLKVIIKHLQPKNVFVSIFESGSSDQTKLYLGLCSTILETIGAPYLIQTSGESRSVGMHRIKYLSHVRNVAMNPLFTQETRFDRILFLNDVFFCASDALSLLMQATANKADMVCGLDYDTDDNGPGFYDTWVARDINGKRFEKRPLGNFTSSNESNALLKANKPFQVQCCWNGMSVLNAAPFYDPYKIKFHQTDTKVLQENETSVTYSACDASEISNLCTDFIQNGFVRAMVVPEVKVAYDWKTYSVIRDTSKVHQQTLVEFKKPINVTECLPMVPGNPRVPTGKLGTLLLNMKSNE